jgi:hypothetical protein
VLNTCLGKAGQWIRRIWSKETKYWGVSDVTNISRDHILGKRLRTTQTCN